MNGAEGINQLFTTLVLTLPGLGNLATLLFLIYFIYAIVGMQLFATVQYNGQLGPHANFRGFWISILTLLRFTTGEAWDDFMHDVAEQQEGCNSNPSYDADYCGYNTKPGCKPLNGCGTPDIYPFLITFTLLVSFVFLNLFIGVILEGFNNADLKKKAIKPEDFIRFAEHWSHYDPDATCFIHTSQLEDFMQTLYRPLGFGGYVDREGELQRRLSKLTPAKQLPQHA
jgi:hypothetical protein